MKKLFVLLQVFMVLFTFVSCRGLTPFSYPLTKWQGGGFELYIGEYEYYNDTLDKVSKNTYGIMLYKTSDETMVFDAEFVYGSLLCIYKHRDSAEQELELIVEYVPLGINNENKCEFGSRNLKNESYSKIFPESIVFRKQCDITPEDIKYDFVEITLEEGQKARGEEVYYPVTQEDGSIEFVTEKEGTQKTGDGSLS